jgi:hypothetical protein
MLIILLSLMLGIYWSFRTHLLLFGTEPAISQILDRDWQTGFRVYEWVRSIMSKA